MFLGFAAVFGLLAVAMGAFGAHGLKGALSEAADFELRLSWWDKAVRYQMWHAIVLLVVGFIHKTQPHKWLTWANISFIIGILVFSGTLYTMTLTNIRVLGAITPIGGLSLITGWAFLAVWAFSKSA